MRGGHGRLVVKARVDFFLLETRERGMGFRRIAELPGYARRALLLRSGFSRAVAHAIRREYGFTEGDVAVLLVPSAALDWIILARQILAAEQLRTSLTEVQLTEGHLIPRGQAFTFVVERVQLKSGSSVSVAESERLSLGEGR